MDDDGCARTPAIGQERTFSEYRDWVEIPRLVGAGHALEHESDPSLEQDVHPVGGVALAEQSRSGRNPQPLDVPHQTIEEFSLGVAEFGHGVDQRRRVRWDHARRRLAIEGTRCVRRRRTDCSAARSPSPAGRRHLGTRRAAWPPLLGPPALPARGCAGRCRRRRGHARPSP